jgi:hypothetical protein
MPVVCALGHQKQVVSPAGASCPPLFFGALFKSYLRMSLGRALLLVLSRSSTAPCLPNSQRQLA